MSLPYRLGSGSLFTRENENTVEPKRVVFLSVEGRRTEVRYFKFIEEYRKEIGIDAVVHLEILRKYDDNSDPENVLELLEEYVEFRSQNMFEDEISNLKLRQYDSEFIRKYLNNRTGLTQRAKNKFEAVLKEEHIDLLYLDFLSKYHGESDEFGIVIDRDYKSHTEEQIRKVVEKCNNKKYRCYITNPCFEFWQLLHVSDVIQEYKSQLEEIRKNELDTSENTYVSNLLHAKTGERKTISAKSFQKYYLPNIDFAIQNAKKFAAYSDLLDHVGSNLGGLFTLLRGR